MHFIDTVKTDFSFELKAPGGGIAAIEALITDTLKHKKAAFRYGTCRKWETINQCNSDIEQLKALKATYKPF